MPADRRPDPGKAAIEIPFLAALVLIGTSYWLVWQRKVLSRRFSRQRNLSVEVGILDRIKTCVSLTIAKFEMVHG